MSENTQQTPPQDQAQEEVCPWESGALGRDPRFVRVVQDDGSVDRALGLVKVGTRVKKRFAKRLRQAARQAGLSLPAYVRQALEEKMRRSN